MENENNESKDAKLDELKKEIFIGVLVVGIAIAMIVGSFLGITDFSFK